MGHCYETQLVVLLNSCCFSFGKFHMKIMYFKDSAKRLPYTYFLMYINSYS